MSKVVTDALSPWSDTAQKALRLGSGSASLLIVGPPGSLHIECAREIHRHAVRGNFERVICTPDAVELRTQLFGPTSESLDEFSLFDPDPPVGAVDRAIGGTLFLEYIDRCNIRRTDWFSSLIDRKSVAIDGHTAQIDPSTRVIASMTTDWIDDIEHAIPQWLMALFENRILLLKPLDSCPDDVLVAVEWLFWRATKSRADEVILSDDAKELLVSRQWPGNYEELGHVINMMVSNCAAGEPITGDACKRILAIFNSTGMRANDRNRWQECRDCVSGLSYRGGSIEASELYQWAGQFSQVSRDRRYDPWLPSLRIAKEVAHTYFYSSDRIRSLIRDAYRSLCVELAGKNYILGWSPAEADVCHPKLRTVLVNPLGPLKSSSEFLPFIGRLLGSGRRQEVILIDEAADYLANDDRIRVVMFCDDFAGTGRQIMSNLIEKLASDESLQKVCESRRQKGIPIALCIVLGICFDDALQMIQTSGPEWLPIMAHAGEQLGEQDRAFSDSSRIFPEPELRAWAKDLVIDQVGRHLYSEWPGGRNDTQALVVTADNVPNNTLPAIWRSGSVQGVAWSALFERASTPLR